MKKKTLQFHQIFLVIEGHRNTDFQLTDGRSRMRNAKLTVGIYDYSRVQAVQGEFLR